MFPCLWKHVVRGDHNWESLLGECVSWGRILAKIAIALLEKLTEMEYKAYNELAARTFSCLGLFYERDSLAFQRDNASNIEGQSSESVIDEHWQRSLATEIIEGTIHLTSKLIERFFSHQIFEEYNDQFSEGLVETILGFFSQVSIHPLTQNFKKCKKVQNFNK